MGRRGENGPRLGSTGTGALKTYPYGFASRFEADRRGGNPGVILGAAHAACFTMPYSFACDEAGFAAVAVDTQAQVRLTKQGNGIVMDRIALRSKLVFISVDTCIGCNCFTA